MLKNLDFIEIFFNGCTQVVPGSQYLKYMKVGNNGGTWMDEHQEFSDLIDQSVLLPVSKGSVILLDSTIFHGVSKNKSEKTRKSITFAYTSVDELLSFDVIPHRHLVSGKRIYKGSV